MNAVLSAIRSNPVRSIIYPLLAILVGTLVARGTIDSSVADIITGVVAVIIGIPATEITRSKVSPFGVEPGSAN